MNLAIRENVSLAEFTTIKIGGKARFFCSARTEDEVCEAVQFAELNSLKIFILGGGSNILIADEGFDGLVLQIALKGISTFAKKDGTIFITAGAGEDWDEFVAFCVEKKFAGVECLSGIPGLVGGTPVQNVGAYGQEVSETIVSVRCFDRKAKKFVELLNNQCGFAYRTSIFNTTQKNRFIVLSVIFKLQQNGNPKILYRDLQNYFKDKKPSLQETRQGVIAIRSAKSMVIDERDENSKSVGSFFKNPIVSLAKFNEIKNEAKNLKVIEATERVPNYQVDDQNVKIPAAWLIEKSGFYKGFQFGRVGLSTNHTLAIVNLGNGTAQDVLDLKVLIQTKVKEKFAIELQPEPVFVTTNLIYTYDFSR
ncbi:MAG: UDP-N-acetylmuramate dehydrogenase [Acidobacteria bacterium]|jgi:UDP-N-acetylmuramate dehydrogenase|nr:UDP-N-acetylmuramate dehydrogenase [Acidobacteriota bacterium]